MNGSIDFKQCLAVIRRDLYELGYRTPKAVLYALLFGVGFRLLLSHRISNYLYFRRPPFHSLLLAMIDHWQLIRLGCGIAPMANIGVALKFPHPNGIFIGIATIGNHVSIYQQVTLGTDGRMNVQVFPTLEDGVVVFAGAKVLGNVTIGHQAVIGAGAVVIDDVPAESVAVGVPAKCKFRSKPMEFPPKTALGVPLAGDIIDDDTDERPYPSVYAR